jgi:hypothetical protein
MSDIYEIKARKYKYKYFKLKQELEGGFILGKSYWGESFVDRLKNFFNLNNQIICTITPPILLDGLTIIQDYPVNKISSLQDFNNEDHLGHLVTYKNDNYKQELKNFEEVLSIDTMQKYTSVLKFACNMFKDDFLKHIKDKTEEPYKSIHRCQNKIIDDEKTVNYGYIISTNTGKSFNELTEDDINDGNIKQILISLKEGIINFITPLYKNGYVLGDINMDNMTLKKKGNQVYFINYSKMHKYTEQDKVEKFANKDNYSYILKRFFKLKKVYQDKKRENDKISRKELLDYFDIKDPLNPHLKIFTDLKNKDHEIDEIYNKYILQIAQNSDIYALSMFIVNILKITSDKIHKITLEKAQLLEEDAKSNTIIGPDKLSEKLQEIIELIPPS